MLDGLRSHSDIDVFVVLNRQLTEAKRRALLSGLLKISDAPAQEGPARRVDLTAMVQPAVRPWRYPSKYEFQYGEGLRAKYESGLVPTPEPQLDLAPSFARIWTTLATGQGQSQGRGRHLGPLPGSQRSSAPCWPTPDRSTSAMEAAAGTPFGTPCRSMSATPSDRPETRRTPATSPSKAARNLYPAILRTTKAEVTVDPKHLRPFTFVACTTPCTRRSRRSGRFCADH